MGAMGNFEECDWDLIQLTKMDDFYNKYGVRHHVCGSCPIEHFMVFDMPGVGKGGFKCSGLYSVTGTIWNNDWELGFRVQNLINRYGLDVVSTCNIIAFLMELYDRGIITADDTDGVPMKRGDENAIITAIRKIGGQEGFGRLFKEGVVQGAKQIGSSAEKYAMAVKGMELEPHECRVTKQLALAMATNTKDLVDSLNMFAYDWVVTLRDEIREDDEKMAEVMYGTKEAAYPLSYEAAVAPTVDMENRLVAGDIMGVCKWLIPWYMTPYLDVPAKLFSLATGVELSEADLLFAAARVVTLERAVNVMRGMRRKDDTLPERLFQEPVPGGPYKGERLIKAKFDKMLDSYYALRGYDKDGVPKEETFKKYGLLSEWQVFKKKALVGAKESSKAEEEM
jgi:aldehyde:ferredoxin oxidoreductase